MHPSSSPAEEQPAPGRTRRGLAATALRVAVSAGLIALVLSSVEWPALLARLGALRWSTLAPVFALNLAAHLFMVERWRTTLSALRMRVGFRELARCYWVGAYYNLFLPSSVGGDTARAFSLYRLTRRPQLAATSSLLDRVAGLAALLALALAASLALPAGGLADGIRIGVGSALTGFLLGGFALSGRIGRWLRRRAGRRGLRLVVSTAVFAVRTLRVRPWLGLRAVALTGGYYAVVAYTHGLLAAAMGAPAPMALLLVNVPLIAIGSMLPISVNGIGLREVLYLGLFTPAGWPPDVVLAAAWVTFATVLASGVPGLLLEIAGRGTTATTPRG